jgi:hypothetical protein
MNSEKEVSWFESGDLSAKMHLLRLCSWFVAGVAGFLQVWASRFTLTPDGNCYLDIATAYLQRDCSGDLVR